MKIIHTSDWHIGQNFYRYDRTEEHLHFFQQLQQIISEEEPDALIVAGDIYDVASPSISSQKLYIKVLMDLKRQFPLLSIIIIAGNHDSPSRLELSKPLWDAFGVSIVGRLAKDEVQEGTRPNHIPIRKGEDVIGWIVAVPFIMQGNLPHTETDSISERMALLYQEQWDSLAPFVREDQPVIAVGHFTAMGSKFVNKKTVGGVDAVDVSLFTENFQYVALGHIHHPQPIDQNRHIRYSGSPFPLSFDEDYSHGVTVVSFEGKQLTDVHMCTITPLLPCFNIPEIPKPWEEVVETLQELPIETTGYVRVNVLKDGTQVANMYEMAQQILEKTKAKLCKVNTVLPVQDLRIKTPIVETVDQFKAMSPLEIAKHYYKEENHIEMSETLVSYMQRAIDDIRNRKYKDED